ncbi:MAG: sulfonate ABC transporter substrate-binding protein [Synechococcales cyanobacterium]
MNVQRMGMKVGFWSWAAVAFTGLAVAGVGQPVAYLFTGSEAAAQTKTVNIGFQKSGNLLFLKAAGTLEERLKKFGFGVTWTEFSSGPPLIEGLNVGSIDFGHSGDAPPIFAQAAGAPLRYVASTRPSPKSVALLVPQGSPVQSVADLKGKKVAFAKGSSAHYFLVEALTQAGLTLNDIEQVFLQPADARTAFEGKNLDAWAIWDPFYAAAELNGAQVLVNGEGLTPFREYYFASAAFVDQHPELVEVIVEELEKTTGNLNQRDSLELAQWLSPELGVDIPILQRAYQRRDRYGAVWVQPEIVAEQQKIADTFISIGVLPKPVRIEDNVWRPD